MGVTHPQDIIPLNCRKLRSAPFYEEAHPIREAFQKRAPFYKEIHFLGVLLSKELHLLKSKERKESF